MGQQKAKKKLAIDYDSTISELIRIAQPGGLIDKSTGSGIGAATDAALGLVGVSTEGSRAIGRLAPIADKVLKLVERFEGPQSDKDTASYKEAAGRLADPTVPNDVRKDAALEILRLMKKRRDSWLGGGDVDTNNPLLK